MDELVAALERTAGHRWHPNHLYKVEADDGQRPGLKLSHAIARVLDVPWGRLWIDDDSAVRQPVSAP